MLFANFLEQTQCRAELLKISGDACRHHAFAFVCAAKGQILFQGLDQGADPPGQLGFRFTALLKRSMDNWIDLLYQSLADLAVCQSGKNTTKIFLFWQSFNAHFY